MKVLVLAMAICASLLIAGCGGDDSSNEATGSGSVESTADQSDPSTTTEGSESSTAADGSDSASGTAPGKTKPEVIVPVGSPPTKLVVKDLEEGDGEEVKDGDKISVAYVGVNVKTGKEFETTWDGKAPSEFKMDSGELIKGWEQGLEGMKVGGRRELIVPAELAYGRDPLVYVVDLVGLE